VPDLQDENCQSVTFHLIDNPIVPDTQPEEPILPTEDLDPPRTRIVGQGVDTRFEAALDFRGESAEVTHRPRGEDDAIDTGLQLQP
jgi:hypothetical protein